jgi:hypothetical protein
MQKSVYSKFDIHVKNLYGYIWKGNGFVKTIKMEVVAIILSSIIVLTVALTFSKTESLGNRLHYRASRTLKEKGVTEAKRFCQNAFEKGGYGYICLIDSTGKIETRGYWNLKIAQDVKSGLIGKFEPASLYYRE